VTVFTSAYKALAHGALNWDTQLDADMATLETILHQGTWAPSIGGTGFTLGTSGGSNGYWTRLGQRVTYNGRILFGSSAAWGTGTPAIISMGNDGTMDTTLSFGTGLYLRASGQPAIPLILTPLSNSSFGMVIAQAGTSSSLTAIAAPAQSDQILVRVDAILT
jgi:hypothetical protein